MLSAIGNLFLLFLVSIIFLAIFTAVIREIFEFFFTLIASLGSSFLFFVYAAIFLFVNPHQSPINYGLGFLSIIIGIIIVCKRNSSNFQYTPQIIEWNKEIDMLELVGLNPSFNVDISVVGVHVEIICFCIDGNQKLYSPEYMLSLNNSQNPCNSIQMSIVDMDTLSFFCKLNEIPENIKRLVFTASLVLHGNKTMASMQSGSIKFRIEQKTRAICNFTNEYFQNETAVILGEVYRKNETDRWTPHHEKWYFLAGGKGFNGGLSSLLTYYGIDSFELLTLPTIHPNNMTYNTIPNFENYETSINIPFSAPILELKNLLNENIPTEFSGNDQNITGVLKNDELTYNFSRADINFTTNNDKIILTTNITGLARIKGRLDLKLFKTKVSAHADIRGQIVGELSLSLNEEWKLNPSIQLSINIADAKIPIKGIGGGISVRSSLTRKVNRKLNEISDKLLLKISEKIDIERSAKKIWKKLHITKQINSDPPVWIKIKPKGIVFKSFDMSDGNNISSGIGVRANIETSITKNLPAPVVISSLPYLQIQKNISDQFIIYLPVNLSIDLINETFSDIIDNQKFEISDNVFIFIKKIKLIPSGDKLIIKLDFKSEKNNFIDSIDGIISLEGNIHYDNVGNSIKLINLDYDLETQRSLISIANLLLKPIFLSKIEKKLVFSLTSELEKLEFKVKRLLDNVRLPQAINSSINVEKIELDSIILKDDYIYLIALCHGRSISAILYLF